MSEDGVAGSGVRVGGGHRMPHPSSCMCNAGSQLLFGNKRRAIKIARLLVPRALYRRGAA